MLYGEVERVSILGAYDSPKGARLECVVEVSGSEAQRFDQPLVDGGVGAHECPEVRSPVAVRYNRMLGSQPIGEYSELEQHFAYERYSYQELFQSEVCYAVESLRSEALRHGDTEQEQVEWLVGKSWPDALAE